MEHGFTATAALGGGLKAWIDSGAPVDTAEPKQAA